MLNWNHKDFLILPYPLTQHWQHACFTQHWHTRAPAQWLHTTPNHRCGSLVFDVSLRELRGKTSWIVRERKERKITFSLYAGEKSSTLYRPWEPSGAWLSAGPPKKQLYKPRRLWGNSWVFFNGQRPCHVLIRFSFSLSRERSHCFDVAKPGLYVGTHTWFNYSQSQSCRGLPLPVSIDSLIYTWCLNIKPKCNWSYMWL